MKTHIFKIILFSLCFIPTGCDELYVEEPEANPAAVFEHLWSTFESEYAAFDERNVDWNDEYLKYRPLVSDNMTDEQLFNVLTMLLSTLDDGHVFLTAPGREVFFSNKIRRQKPGYDLFNLKLIKENYLENGSIKESGESFLYGKIKNERLGYIHFDHVGENFQIMNEFLAAFEDSEGIIIDLRHNSGGDFTWSFPNLGRFTTERKFVFRSKTKNGKGENEFTPWKNWYIEPQGQYVNKPVTVLTDRYTISAAERTVMAFKALPGVTLLGDTTNGAHGTMIGRELVNGWNYSLVPQKVELSDGKSYEGIGLAPDVRVVNLPAEMQSGKDKTLETAISLLDK